MMIKIAVDGNAPGLTEALQAMLDMLPVNTALSVTMDED